MSDKCKFCGFDDPRLCDWQGFRTAPCYQRQIATLVGLLRPIPVEERLPPYIKDYKITLPVLGYVQYDDQPGGWYTMRYQDGRWEFDFDYWGDYPIPVTHWIEMLPAPTCRLAAAINKE